MQNNIRVALEDSIMLAGHPVTAGSKILENFISPIDATVVSRLVDAGYEIVERAEMAEFGLAGLFDDGGVVGTDSGAVGAVADARADFALCNDYTGLVAQKAIDAGLYYIRPTYGTVSRYGLAPAVPSMDQIGIVCRNPSDGFRLLSIISGYDPKDGAMYAETGVCVGNGAEADEGASTGKSTPERELVVGIPKNVFSMKADVIKQAENIKNVNFHLAYYDVFPEIMRILCCAEISGCISRYDGVKFGYRTSEYSDLHGLYTGSRTEGFGQDTKLAAILGAMVLSQENYTRYYDKAMRIRRLIRESLEFDKYDIIILPAFESGERLALHALPRLCGLPAVTMPMYGGVTIVADSGCEDTLNAFIKAVGA